MSPLRPALLLLALWLGAGPAARAGPLSDWAAVVVAGDFQAHGGGETEAFDNARRDVALALRKAGFEAGNIRQFSARPERYGEAGLGLADIDAIYDGLEAAARAAPAGCFLYLTSHGMPEGAALDDKLLTPEVMAGVIDEACPARPTVAVISACFSGVFVRPLARPDRMIVTAARRDRSSFGCGEDDKYPFFDDCFLRALPRSGDFVVLGREIQACVAEREAIENVEPPSEPQVSIGAALRPLLPLYAFAH